MAETADKFDLEAWLLNVESTLHPNYIPASMVRHLFAEFQSREDALRAEIAILVTREKNQNHTITEMNDAHSRLADKYITERSEANHLRIANRECDMERFGLVSEIERLKSELSSAHLALTGFQVAEAQEKTNGVQLADIVDNQIAEIERLRGELSSARADGMIAAADAAKAQWEVLSAEDTDSFEAGFNAAIESIRAAAALSRDTKEKEV